MFARQGLNIVVLLATESLLLWIPGLYSTQGNPLPAFGRNTVLVWKLQNLQFSSNFVVRIAEFEPDRFIEWEDDKTQGTLFMPARDILNAGGYVTSQLFEGGRDARSSNVITLWLSRKIFNQLKEKGRVKLNVDGVAGLWILQGKSSFAVDVNGISVNLPVIRVTDDRGGERWFLDQVDNSLLLKHTLREFTQTLVSITTNRPNTLRWIKGRKLADLQQ